MESKNDYPKALVAIAWLGAGVYSIGALNDAGLGLICLSVASIVSLLMKT